jgi:hypothetical protein
MRKLLHLAFAGCKTHEPFDKDKYSWDTPARFLSPSRRGSGSDGTTLSAQNQAAGLKHSAEPAQKEVTAACEAGFAIWTKKKELVLHSLPDRQHHSTIRTFCPSCL